MNNQREVGRWGVNQWYSEGLSLIFNTLSNSPKGKIKYIYSYFFIQKRIMPQSRGQAYLLNK